MSRYLYYNSSEEEFDCYCEPDVVATYAIFLQGQFNEYVNREENMLSQVNEYKFNRYIKRERDIVTQINEREFNDYRYRRRPRLFKILSNLFK